MPPAGAVVAVLGELAEKTVNHIEAEPVPTEYGATKP